MAFVSLLSAVVQELWTCLFTMQSASFKEYFWKEIWDWGEGYSEGLIEVNDEDYKEFLCICVYATSLRILRRLSIFDMIAAIRARGGGYFTKPRENATIDNHYSLSDWFDNDDDSNSSSTIGSIGFIICILAGSGTRRPRRCRSLKRTSWNFMPNEWVSMNAAGGKPLLDLGCGWGGVLFFMAEKFGIRAKGLTLSAAQHRYITKEITTQNLQDLVTVELRNVHDMEGCTTTSFPSAC